MDPDRPQPPHIMEEQAVLNFHWPERPRSIKPYGPGVPVRARVIWERDGEEYVEGTALRWDAEHVYVEILRSGGRLNVNGVWLKPEDVYRREPPESKSSGSGSSR